MSPVTSEQATQEFSGRNAMWGLADAGICAAFGGLVYPVTPQVMAPYLVTLTLMAMATALSTQYRLRISTQGIEYAVLVAWVFPTKRQRYLLDATIDIYDSFDAPDPEGVCVRPVRIRGDETESPCFGPSTDQAAMLSLHKRANQAIQRARELLPPTPLDLRCPLLAHEIAKLDVQGATRDAQSRLREVAALDSLTIGTLFMPAGTVLHFNGEDYLDPRRQDLLTAAVLKTQVRLPMGIDVPAGTRIAFTSSGEICALRGPLETITIDGFRVDGTASIGIAADGHLNTFTLKAPVDFNGWLLAAGTTFSTWSKSFGRGPSWHCTLSATLHLPELDLRPGDTVVFDKASKILVTIFPSGEHVVDGKQLSSGPIPVHPDGRINRSRARKTGALRR